MKIYNEDRTQELLREDCDLQKGYFTDIQYDHIYREEIEEIPEEGHYEVIAEYPNGGKDLEWVVDVPKIEGRESFVEEIPYQCFILYTEEELANRKREELIEQIKKELNNSDYIIVRFLEGSTSKDKYVFTKKQREAWRKIINTVEQTDSYEELLKIEEEFTRSLSGVN